MHEQTSTTCIFDLATIDQLDTVAYKNHILMLKTFSRKFGNSMNLPST